MYMFKVHFKWLGEERSNLRWFEHIGWILIVHYHSLRKYTEGIYYTEGKDQEYKGTEGMKMLRKNSLCMVLSGLNGK